MRILTISNYYPPLEVGGWEQLTREVVLELLGRGHQMSVLTSDYLASEVRASEPRVHRRLYLDSPNHFNYQMYYPLLYGWRTRQNRRSLSQTVARLRPDILFINGMWNLSHDVARYAEQLCPGRVVYYIASTWPTEVDPHTLYWSASAQHAWRRMPKRLVAAVALRTLLLGLRGRQLHFAHVLCVSEYIRRYMVNEAGISRTQTRVVYNGIDVKRFAPQGEFRSSAGPLRLLYAGGIWEHKGVHTIVEAMWHVARGGYAGDVHLTLVGSGAPDYVRSLRDRIRDLDIESLITFGKRIPREQMPVLLQQYDCLLFPSIGPEALPRIVQEAMACGLLVIGSDRGGTPEILCDGKNGLMFEAGNAPMLADKILQIIRDQDRCKQLVQAARKTVEERFTLDRMVDEIEAYFGSVVESEGAII